MRDPSLHIPKSKLMLVLKEVLDSNDIQYQSIELLATQLLKRGKKFNVSYRSIQISNDRVEKKIKRMTSTRTENYYKFATVLHLVRKQLKHRNITKITEESKQWDTLKKITGDATKFANEFQLKDGYQIYIKLGLSMMNRFFLNKFVNLSDAITETHMCIEEIQQDPNQGLTESIHNYYQKRIRERLGQSLMNYKDMPSKYVCFIRVGEECMKRKIRYQDYIDSQFHGFEWAEAIPDPLQLLGVKALERLQKYLYESNKKVGEVEQDDSNGSWADYIKNKKDDKN